MPINKATSHSRSLVLGVNRIRLTRGVVQAAHNNIAATVFLKQMASRFYTGLLWELELPRRHRSAIDDVLTSLAAAIQKCEDAIETAEQSYIKLALRNDPWADEVLYAESTAIETLLGVAFIICQTEINAVVSTVKELHRSAGYDGYVLNTTERSRKSVLVFGNPIVGNSGYSQIQAIDAFANYFKHHDEWISPWSMAEGQARHTIDILLAVGVREAASGALFSAADIIGLADYKRLPLLIDMLQEWARNLQNGYKAEVSRLGLLEQEPSLGELADFGLSLADTGNTDDT